MTRLDEMMQHICKEHVYIQTHNFPDPDAIACAFGLQKILEYRGIASTICYKGKIDRYNTLELTEQLGIGLENYEIIREKMQEEDEVILVDAQNGNFNIADLGGTKIICIDHHPTFERASYRYSDIRPEYGACSTIIAEYFFENEIPMDTKMATALSYGIRCDTDRLSRGTCRQDVKMLYRMYDMSDQGMIQTLENRELYFEDLMAYSKAIENIRVYDKVSFTSAGENCPEALIASVSDFMLELVEVEVSVVYAIQENGVKLSVRSEDGRHDVGKIISRALKGYGNGGGHTAMAGGFIPFSEKKPQVDEIIGIVQQRILELVKDL